MTGVILTWQELAISALWPTYLVRSSPLASQDKEGNTAGDELSYTYFGCEIVQNEGGPTLKLG